MVNNNLVGGIPTTPLKNDGVSESQLGWPSQLFLENFEKSKSCSKAPTRFRYTYIWYDETCVWWSSPFLYHMQRHQILRKRDEFTALWNAGNAYGTFVSPFALEVFRLCLENGPTKSCKLWNSLPQTWNSYWKMLAKCNSQHTLDIFTAICSWALWPWQERRWGHHLNVANCSLASKSPHAPWLFSPYL